MNFIKLIPISRISTSILNNFTSINILRSQRLLHILGPKPPLLAVTTPQLTQVCGFKVKGRLRKRCKDCYIVVRDCRNYIICPTHPRHKQMSFVKKEKHQRILTPGAIQCKNRPW